MVENIDTMKMSTANTTSQCVNFVVTRRCVGAFLGSWRSNLGFFGTPYVPNRFGGTIDHGTNEYLAAPDFSW